MTIFATIFAKNYLAHARTLMESVARYHPEARRVALLVDRPDGHFDPAGESFEIIASDELPIVNRRRFFFQYTLLEAATAMKPLFLSRLVRQAGVDRVIYLDPDIVLFQPLDPVFRALESCDWAMTPHLTLPARPETELHVLRSGVYNLGFLGLRSGERAEALLRWWAERVLDSCYADPDPSVFVDQRWMDLAATVFSPVAVIHDPGCNAAYWNLPHRPIERLGSSYLAAQVPLRFFHFSGFQPDHPETVSTHAPEMQTGQSGGAAELMAAYRDLLRSAGWPVVSKWPYSFGTFDSGRPITDVGRSITRVDEEFGTIVNPFSAEGEERFVRFWTSAQCEDGTTRLAWTIYQRRQDLQKAFPVVPGSDCAALTSWLHTFGKDEYRIRPDLLVDTPLIGSAPVTLGGVRLRGVLDRLSLLSKRLKQKS